MGRRKEDITGPALTDGQRDLVESVYPYCWEQAIRYCHRHGLTRHVEDAAHQGVIGAMIAARKFDPDHDSGANFLTYAAHWIYQAIQSWHRRRKFEVGVTIAPNEDGVSLIDEAPDRHQSPPLDWTEEQWEGVLSSLTDLQRRAVIRRFVRGETYRVIAADEGRSVFAIQNRVERALLHIRERLSTIEA